MPNTPQDFIDNAKLLQANAASEMDYRTATNRGYYATFHVALHVKNTLSLPEAINQRGGSHAKLFSSLEECKPRHSTMELSVRQIGIMASRLLKPYRVNADYDIHLPFPKRVMDEVIAKSEFLIGKSKGIITGHQPGTAPPTTTSKSSLRVVK